MTPGAHCVLVLSVVALSATGCDDPPVPPCPDGGSTLTWDNFGHGFLVRECNPCHGEAVTERQGAPYDFTFDDLDKVLAHRQRIYIRATGANGDRPTMPPGPVKPPADERARLAEWLQCAQ